MDDMFQCQICKEPYNKNSRKAFMLECGHSACSKCIKFYKDAKQESFECEKCCRKTNPTNIENKSLYKNDGVQNINIIRTPQKDEFEIYVRKKNTQEKFSLLVKKDMFLKELINKIQSQENIDPQTYELCFKKPLIDKEKTLESYGITRTVTITMITRFDGGKCQ